MSESHCSVNRSSLGHGWTFVAAAALLALASGSCSSAPSRVHPPGINASSASSEAIELYDTNGDGSVGGEELEKAPGLKAALASMDKNSDKGIDAAEIAKRIETWQATRIGLMTFGFTLSLDGSPLEGATVTFEPESFLGDDIKAAVATTDMFGTGSPTIPKDQRPDPTAPPGVQVGVYRVKISKLQGGKETIPAIYNTETILGQEVAMDVGEIANRRVVYAMKSK